MADGVNRIVPAAISPEAITSHGRERKKRETAERPKRKPTAADTNPAVNPLSDDLGAEVCNDKGKSLDIKA